jgi:hypothetical protein
MNPSESQQDTDEDDQKNDNDDDEDNNANNNDCCTSTNSMNDDIVNDAVNISNSISPVLFPNSTNPTTSHYRFR